MSAGWKRSGGLKNTKRVFFGAATRASAQDVLSKSILSTSPLFQPAEGFFMSMASLHWSMASVVLGFHKVLWSSCFRAVLPGHETPCRASCIPNQA